MCMERKKAVFIGLVRDHRTRIGRIKAFGGGSAGCKSKGEAG
mgnify:CR=1 FL=1